MIDFSKFQFQPVMQLPADPAQIKVFDHSQARDPEREEVKYGIGRYNEKRPNMYTTDLYADGRDIHMGLDIVAPTGDPVFPFFPGEIFLAGYNPAPGDYGNVIVTCHQLGNHRLWALYGHLNAASIQEKKPGQALKIGEALGWLGETEENGGWAPHLHLQLSLQEPQTHDMPGVVNKSGLQAALETYPDPQLVTGRFY